jgi:hypothetical protein
VIRIGKRGESHRRGLRNTANIYGIDGVNSGVSGAIDSSLRPKIMADPRRDFAVDLSRGFSWGEIQYVPHRGKPLFFMGETIPRDMIRPDD